ncbi:MAG: STAS domain-containing protein [Cyanobacteria bacterium J06623_5]
MATINAPVTVVCPSGVLNAESASSFEKQLFSAVSGGNASELVVDMSRVESLDNAGLVSFMSALNAAQPRCKRLSICSAPPSIKIVFELTQLDRLFTMVDQTPALAA